MQTSSHLAWITAGLASLLASTLATNADAAKVRAPNFTLEARINDTQLIIEGAAPAGYHFNLKAPHRIGKAKPIRVTHETLRFELPNRAAQELSVTAFVCDKKETICERQVVRGVWNGESLR